VFNPWFLLACDAAQLGFEAQSVIALRLARLATGGASAWPEAQRMVSEKAAAVVEAQIADRRRGGRAKKRSRGEEGPSDLQKTRASQ
jgi:hypothetical protein